MTYQGGTNNLGAIFKIMPDGTNYSKLLDFAGAANGSYPYGSLISDGTFLYGMTSQGGSANLGTVFKYLPPCTPTNTPATTAICSNDSIFLQGTFQTTAGTYYDTLISVNGCDSVITTTLTVNPLPTVALQPFSPDTVLQLAEGGDFQHTLSYKALKLIHPKNCPTKNETATFGKVLLCPAVLSSVSSCNFCMRLPVPLSNCCVAAQSWAVRSGFKKF